MIHGRFRAMGTLVEAWSQSVGAFDETAAWFARVESTCSRFLPDSELSLANRDPRKAVVVSDILAAVLTSAAEARTATDGLVDAATGASVVAWGYDRTFEEVVGLESEPENAIPETDWHIEGGVLCRPPGTLLDLGGIGKGWTADAAVEGGLADVVSAGGDIRSNDPRTCVPVLDPWGTAVANISLGSGALATSSLTRRRWKVGDGEAHHLIDPRTGRPADSPILSATVVAETAVEAEAGAKAVLILGEQGLSWADRQDWISSALIIWHDGSAFATSGLDLMA